MEDANTKLPTLRELFCLEDGYDIHMVAVSVHDTHKPPHQHTTFRDQDDHEVYQKSSKKHPTLRDLFCLKDYDDDDDDATEVSRRSSKKHPTLRELFCFQGDEDRIQMVAVSSPETPHKPAQKLPTLRELLSLEDDEADDVDCYLKSEADHSSETILCYRRIFAASGEGGKVVIPPRKSMEQEVLEGRKSWKKKIEEMIRMLTRFGSSKKKKKKERDSILVDTDLKSRMRKWEDQRKAKSSDQMMEPNRGDGGHGQRSKSKRKREEWEKQLDEYLNVW